MYAPTFLRPDTIAIERRVRGPVDPTGVAGDPTGEGSLSPTTIAAGVIALIDPLLATSPAAGDFRFEIEGEVYVASHALFIDGLEQVDFAGALPGQTVTVNGVPYIVAANGGGAFVDLQQGDRVTDENGWTYLVLAVERYYEIQPNQQARIVRGRSW